MASDFAKELRDKKVFYDLCKSSNNPQVRATNKNNHIFKYFSECKKNKVAPLSILCKVHNHKLQLNGY